jgi:hypothetical protein
MAKFVLLLNHAPDRYARLSEDEAMTIFKDYMQWMEKATSDGFCTGGYKLSAGPGRILTAVDGGVDVHDSPFAELSEILGGLMVIEAADYRAAVEIARTHPHLVHNKTLEIRQLDHD